MNGQDIDITARTIYGEARGEPFDGKLAVGHVIRNRTQDNRWPSTPVGVCVQAKQFSCWNEGDPNRPTLLSVTLDNPTFQQCYLAACQALLHGTDSISGANHFHAIGIKPSWAKQEALIGAIGHHYFYKL